MHKAEARSRGWQNIMSPWILIGAVLVLLPIMLVMAIGTIQLQRSNAYQLLAEKGEALIKSFEAGTRAGVLERFWGWAHLQRLLTATASQPDIDYIMLTDSRGKVLAHSDPEKVGRLYDVDIDFTSLSRTGSTLTRTWTDQDGHKIFEVIRHFAPSTIGRTMRMGPGMMMNRWHWPHDAPNQPSSAKDLFIFVGLRMDSVLEAQQRDIRHIVLMAAILFLVGMAGVSLVFLTHSYRQATSSLSKVKAFSEQVVANMPVGLLAWDEEGKLAEINQVACDLLGLGYERQTGRPIREVLPPALMACLDDNPRFLGKLDRELRWDGKDKEVALQVTGAPLFESGNLRGYICLLKDLSEVRKLRQQVERHRRLATMGRLAAGVAHEIRNPLSSIKGFATYFKERCGQDDKSGQIADLMIREVDRLNRVVTQLLEFSRPVKVNPRKVELASFLADSLQLVEKRARQQKVELKLDCPADLEAAFDPDQMKQVLLNLYLNGLDAMPDGGVLRVRAGFAENEAELALEVVDTGQGVDKEMAAKVFDPYFTTKPGGTGLGLAIVHNIVEAHNGRLIFQSEPGRGSRVEVVLPRREEKRR